MKQNELTIIPHIVVNPSGIVAYNESIWDRPRTKQCRLFIDVNQPTENQTKFINSVRKANGKVSDQAKRKISKALEYLITTAKTKTVQERLTGKHVTFSTSFLTLTLPSSQIHTDNEIINKCLNSFLNELRKYYNVQNYVWRAELQKNNNIHFHIITDSFVPWYDARNRWNRIVNKLGYVDKFHEKHGHRTPNSTDIHSTRKIKNLKAYLCKYMAKDHNPAEEVDGIVTETRTQTGRIWACNQELSQTRGLNLIVDSEIDQEMKKLLKDKTVRIYESSYFTCYYFDYHLLLKSGANILFKYFSDYLFERLNFSEQLKIAN